MRDFSQYRALFPHITERIYLNHAAVSPMHRRSLAAIEAHLQERSGSNIEFWPALQEVRQRFKERVGRLIHAPVEHIAVTDSTSMGLNWLARGLDWKPGDRILLNDFEFPSNVYPFLNLRRQGVEVDFVKHREGRILVEDIAAAMRPETRLLSISFVEFLNGFRNDLRSIGELCRERGVIFCVDGIQGVGALQIEVEKWGIDFLACGGHKWLMWPLGTGFFYVSSRLMERMHPMATGWLSVQNPWDFFDYRLEFPPDATRFEPGNFNVIGIVGAIASLDMFLEIGPENIQTRILSLTHRLMTRLRENGYTLFSVPDPEHRSGIVTFHHPAAEELYRFLKEQRVHVSLREGMIRVAPHFYNTEDEIDILLELIQKFDRSHQP